MKHLSIGHLSIGLLAIPLLGPLSACYDGVGKGGDEQADEADSGEGDTSEGGDEALVGVGEAGMRRLSAVEYDASVRDLLGVTLPPSESVLPEDLRTPFDNDYTIQNPTKALIEAAEHLAGEAATALVNDVAAREALVGCTPSGPSDEACLRSFLQSFLRHAFHRPVTSEEIDRFVALAQPFAVEAGDFWVGVDTVIRAALQHPSFLYRIETGSPVEGQPGVYRLSSHELAARLSYFLWGSLPDPWLLDEADADALATPEQIQAIAEQMLDDPRARERVLRFHAMWLDYERLPHAPELTAALEAETAALLGRVIFDEDRPYHDVFQSSETFISDYLAQHYGLPLPGSAEPVWVDYGDSGRKGLLSHGSFLSVGAKAGDTSPTLRGKVIRTRLFCEIISPPPPGVNTDEPPATSEDSCKWDDYAIHRDQALGCATCHDLMDPIGFGLENYDHQGRYRTHDKGKPQCTIAGVGEITGVGEFSGPGELADLMIGTGDLDECVIVQLYRFAMGRYDLADEDFEFIDLVAERVLEDPNFSLEQVLVEFVSSPQFSYRREEVAP